MTKKDVKMQMCNYIENINKITENNIDIVCIMHYLL